MSRIHPPRLPVAPTEPGDDIPADKIVIPINDRYRQQLVDDERLTLMHLRIYDFWRPQVCALTAYQLALTAFSDNAAYQRLKREVMAS